MAAEKVNEASEAVLDALIQLARSTDEAPVLAERVKDLAEAWAWLNRPAQDH